ncbi:MAG: peptidase, partial [Propionivibrio sp.]|nr:peptidase [Propionivibrio sp.]
MLGLGLPSLGGVQAVEKRVAEKRVVQKSKAKPSTNRSKSAKAKTVKKQTLTKSKRRASGSTAPVSNPGVLAVQSGSALVVEQAGGDAIYQKNAAQVVPIASITKLMTAMVVLDGSPALQVPVTITDDDVDYLRGSRSRLHV